MFQSRFAEQRQLSKDIAKTSHDSYNESDGKRDERKGRVRRGQTKRSSKIDALLMMQMKDVVFEMKIHSAASNTLLFDAFILSLFTVGGRDEESSFIFLS